jgi:O-antigen/teichoic acid export membrane protein
MLRKISDFVFQKKEILTNIKNAGLYFLGSIVQSILALIASPIYAYHLSADEFGILGYFGAISNFLAPLFILGMTSVYMMQYFRQSEADNKKLLFNITFFLCCFNTIIMFISYIAIYLYFQYLQVNIPLNPFAWFVLIALILENIKHFVLINLRIRKEAFDFFIFSSINALLSFALGLLFVAYFKWGAEGRMFAPIVSTLILLPYCIYILRKYTTINFNINIFFKAAKAAIPLVLAAYAYVPIENIDRFYLERINNLSELGLYNIGVTIAGYVLLAYVALGSAVEPDIFKAVAEKDNKRLINSAIMIFVPYSLLVVIFMLFSRIIIWLLTAGRYVAAQEYTNITLIAVFLMSIYWFLDKIFIALGKTKLNLLINVSGGVSSIIIMYFAVDNYQFIGAAYGKVLVAIIIVVVASILVYVNLRRQNTYA